MSSASISENSYFKCFCCSYVCKRSPCFYNLCVKKIIFKWKWYINNIYVSHSEIGYSIIQNTKTQESIVSVAPKFCIKNTPVPSGCGSIFTAFAKSKRIGKRIRHSSNWFIQCWLNLSACPFSIALSFCFPSSIILTSSIALTTIAALYCADFNLPVSLFSIII